jgi:surface polysaccharide O-acyltransferase-like enzyme
MRHHIYGFDYLRALFTVLVVVWHANAVGFLANLNPYLQHWINIFYYNICLLAVPVFFTISLFLFYKKQAVDKVENTYLFQKRLTSLMQVYCAWMFIGIVFNSLISRGSYLLRLLSVNHVLHTMITGSRPELFFLFSLMLMTFLCFLNSILLIKKSKDIWIQCILVMLSLVVLLIVSFYTLKTGRTVFSAYWNPICFVPYVFSSYLILYIFDESRTNSKLLKLFHKRNVLVASVMFLTFIILSWLEWKSFYAPSAFGGYLLPPYARVSLVIGSFLICYLAILYIQEPPPYLVRILSKESLGIYLMHMYFLFLAGFLTARFQAFQFFQIPPRAIFNPVVNVFFAVALSTIASKIFINFRIGKYILLSSRQSK